jgi:hypothetical protein
MNPDCSCFDFCVSVNVDVFMSTSASNVIHRKLIEGLAKAQCIMGI